MAPLEVISIVLALAWAAAGLATWRSGAGPGAAARRAALCLLVAAGHALAAGSPALAPLTLATWLVFGLALPTGSLVGLTRRAVAVVGTVALAGWSGLLVANGSDGSGARLGLAAVAVTIVSGTAVVLGCRQATAAQRRTIQWLAAGAVLAAAADAVFLSLHVLLDAPHTLPAWLLAPLVLVPLSQLGAALTRATRAAETVLVEAIATAGIAVLVVAVYLVVVVGLGRPPVGGERNVFVSSIAAAVVAAGLALPVRHRLVELGSSLVGGRQASADVVVATFGARMTRAVPMDEVMLQLAESLRATIATRGAQVWVGTEGRLTLAVSVPSRSAEPLVLGEHERTVLGRARIGGHSWTSMWLPQLLDPDGGDLRVAPVAHLGELLGLVVVRRAADDPPIGEDDERLLVDLARQLGLALHNVRLDSALQRSLEELKERNAELQASRLRIVTASDESRRAIERNLHDGAQQHLVALAVKLSLVRQLAGEDPDLAGELLEELRADVQTTIRELRELAHGIYPPLLRDRGLGEALRTSAARCPLPCTVDVDLPGRYPEEVETAAYFCCLEAIQNAGKYAGEGAEVTVRVGADAGALWFTVSDDGAGFSGDAAAGHGFVNMQDRLGALGGQLSVGSAPGSGTTVRGSIPAAPVGSDAPAALPTGLPTAAASAPERPVPAAPLVPQDESVTS